MKDTTIVLDKSHHRYMKIIELLVKMQSATDIEIKIALYKKITSYLLECQIISNEDFKSLLTHENSRP
jgi:hypothetical protein